VCAVWCVHSTLPAVHPISAAPPNEWVPYHTCGKNSQTSAPPQRQHRLLGRGPLARSTRGRHQLRRQRQPELPDARWRDSRLRSECSAGMYGRRSERSSSCTDLWGAEVQGYSAARACAGKVGCGGREGTRQGSEAEADGSATRQGVSVRGQCVRVCVGRGSCLDMDETESLVSLEFKPPRMRLPCAPIALHRTATP
jgi:hypothetical protein